MVGIDPVHRGELDSLAARSSARITGENFPVALRFLPRQPRRELTAVYGYARLVDDVGDEAAGDRHALLDLVERDVRSILDGAPTLPAVVALAPVISAGRVPLDPFLDLIAANRSDQVVTRRESFDDLLGYCRLSAAPVGRIVLHLAGSATEENVADSDAVCAALQVLEHCQDVGEDALMDRVYLPSADLRCAGVSDDDLLTPTTGHGVRQAVAVNVERAEVLLHAGRPLVRRLSGWARFAVAGYVAGGLATARALHRHDYDVLGADIAPSRMVTATLTARVLVRP